MKLKNAFELAGLRGKPQHYGFTTRSIELDGGCHLTVTDWEHPRLSDGRDLYASMSSVVQQHQEIINAGDFCIDIGAHVGDTTLPMGVAAGRSGCVLALEPNPYVYHVLENNARANRHVANIETIMAAAGPTQGFLEFEYSDSGFCNGGRHESISALKYGHPYKLSVFCIDLQRELRSNYAEELKRLKLIKVDAEGFDLFVLQSLLEIIDEYRPIVKAEIWKKTTQQYRQQMFDLFHSPGYDVYKLQAEPFVKGDKLDRESIAQTGHFDILCFPK